MKFVRIKNGNPYKPSKINTGANTFGAVSGKGVFAFVLGETVYHENGLEPEELTMELLDVIFGLDEKNVHILDVDEHDTITFGEGRYAEPFYEYYDECVWLPEAYIEFSEY